MFEGDLKKGLPEDALKAFSKRAKKQGANKKSVNNLITAVTKVRGKI